MNTIDVLIPVYNRQEFLKEALQSVERQTYTDWRVIFYNDGSTDLSEEMMEEFCNRHPETLYLSGNVNKGVGHARGKLLEASDAPYCAWMDSDDVSHKDRFDRQLSYLENNPARMVFTEMFFFQHPKEYYQTHTRNRIDVSKYTTRGGLNNNMNFATGMFRGELRKYKFDDKKVREDAQWLSKMIGDGVPFGYIPLPLYYCRRHDNRTTILQNKK